MDIFRTPQLVRHIRVDQTSAELDREWIVTNGLGGYASGTIAGLNTRRFHGWLIAALSAPRGRMMMMNQIAEASSRISALLARPEVARDLRPQTAGGENDDDAG